MDFPCRIPFGVSGACGAPQRLYFENLRCCGQLGHIAVDNAIVC